MAFLQELFLGIVNMSITASIVLAVVLVLRLLLARAPRRFSYLLWGIVLFRLLCPVSLPSQLSALDVTEGRSTGQGRMEYFSPGEQGEMAASMSLVPAAPGEEPSRDGLHVTVEFQKRMLPALALVWLTGIVGMAAGSIWSVARLHRKVECSLLLRENIYLADHISTPFVLGLVRPRIYLPSGLGEEEREYILLHEQHHIRRRDYLMKPLAFLALCLHWFNPLVWLAFVLAGRDMEMSCDEAVMGKIGQDARREYAALLLQLSTGKRMLAASPLAFGEGNPKKRIKNIMHYKKPAVLAALGAVAVCIVAAGCLMTNPADSRPSMEWAKSLEEGEVAYGELVVFNQEPEKQYRYFSGEEVSELVALIRESRGTYLESHEEMEGGSIFFYLTMEDGTTHQVGNMGNTYLFIDGDYFDAGYDWLSTWEDRFGAGNDRLPPGFLGDVPQDAGEIFQARVIEIGNGTLLVEPVEGSWELSSADRITVPIRHMDPSPEPEAGDLVEIRYDGSILESYPAQLGEVYEITVLEEPETALEEEEAIHAAIMEHYASEDTENADFSCCSFVWLGTEPETGADAGNQGVTYYGWVLYQEFRISEDGIQAARGSQIPVALTFERIGDAYTLAEYWEPRGGGDFQEDIHEKFPQELWADGMDSQKFILMQIQHCYAQAISHARLDTEPIISGLLKEICSSPEVSSAPGDYINDNNSEYRELLYYGDDTIRYCLERFEGGNETGLEGHVMARACEKLLDLKGKLPAEAETASTGQEWYQALKAHAGNVVEAYLGQVE